VHRLVRHLGDQQIHRHHLGDQRHQRLAHQGLVLGNHLVHHLDDQRPDHQDRLDDQRPDHLDRLDDQRPDHLGVDLDLMGPLDGPLASLASSLDLDVEHPELPGQMKPLGESCQLIHQTGYYPDAEQLPADPCQKIHQTGYYPDVDLRDVVRLDVRLLVWSRSRILQLCAQLLALVLLEQQRPSSDRQLQRLFFSLQQVLVLELQRESLYPRQ
jgi:hypothetical protein